jgi:hypothetical protein
LKRLKVYPSCFALFQGRPAFFRKTFPEARARFGTPFGADISRFS